MYNLKIQDASYVFTNFSFIYILWRSGVFSKVERTEKLCLE